MHQPSIDLEQNHSLSECNVGIANLGHFPKGGLSGDHDITRLWQAPAHPVFIGILRNVLRCKSVIDLPIFHCTRSNERNACFRLSWRAAAIIDEFVDDPTELQ